MSIFKRFTSIFCVILLACSFCFCAFAAADEYTAASGDVLSVAHWGAWEKYPIGSLENVEECVSLGVDMVSIPVARTSDGMLVPLKSNELALSCVDENGAELDSLVSETEFSALSEYKLLFSDFTVSEYNPVALETVFELTQKGIVIILDNAWEYRDEIYALAAEKDVLSSVVIRTDASASEIVEWVSSKDTAPQVIGVYEGNVVFMATSKANKLLNNGMACVQYASNNFFATVFEPLAMSRFTSGRGRALVSAYDKALCGQREDSREGWDDLIARGYTVIETDNPELLVSYLAELDSQRERLVSLCEKAERVDLSKLSAASSRGLLSATENGRETAENNYASCQNIEDAISAINTALSALVPGEGIVDTQRNSLNITAGKVIAVILCGAGVVGVQVFFHKRQKPVKKK